MNKSLTVRKSTLSAVSFMDHVSGKNSLSNPRSPRLSPMFSYLLGVL